MATKPVTEIAYFEIVPLVPEPFQGRQVWAQYGKRTVEPVASRGDYGVQISRAAASGKLPGNVIETNESVLNRGQRLLDIVEKKGDGREDIARAYAFRLNARHGDSDLIFVDKPFYALRTFADFASSDGFIQDFRTYKENGQTRWASFICNLEAVRTSPLADWIRELTAEHERLHREGVEHDHVHGIEHSRALMALPFCFNVIDSKLRAAPWVTDPMATISLLLAEAEGENEADHTHDHEEESGRSGALRAAEIASPATSPWTHGGVHPAVMAFSPWTHGGVHPEVMPFVVVEL